MQTKNFFRQIGLAQIPLIIGLVIMAIALPLTAKLSQETQDLRNLAVDPIPSPAPTGEKPSCFNLTCPSGVSPGQQIRLTARTFSPDEYIQEFRLQNYPNESIPDHSGKMLFSFPLLPSFTQPTINSSQCYDIDGDGKIGGNEEDNNYTDYCEVDFTVTIPNETLECRQIEFIRFENDEGSSACSCPSLCTTPTPTDGGPAFLLGKVVNESPRYSGCNNQRFTYGSNCGNSNCFGAPNYQVTWSQSGLSNSVGNNECWSGEPRYTFERTANPKGDQDGEIVSVNISAGTNTRLVRWFMETTDSNGNVLSGSRQQGTFSSPGQNQTVSIKVYKSGSYVWNHLWFVALDPENTTTPTPVITKPSCSGLTLNGQASNITVNVGTTVRLAATVSDYGLISSAKVNVIGDRVWNAPDIIRYPYGTRGLSGTFSATQVGVYAVETNAYDNNSCNYLCSGGGIFYRNTIGPNRCVDNHEEWENIGSCTSAGCNRYITVVDKPTATPTRIPSPTPTTTRYVVCGPDCKCGYSTTQKPNMSNAGDVKCTYLPIGAGCCSSCDRLVRVTDFSISNTNPVPGETLTLKANGVSNKAPLTYRFSYYKQNATESIVTRVGYGCANWDSSKLYPVKKMSNQYWTLIGSIIPTQDMVVSRISIPFKNSSSTAWSAHVAITDSVGLVSDNNFDSDSQPGSANHIFNLPNNPVACSKGGQRTMLVPRNTRKTEFYFDTRPVLKKGVAYKVWAATEGYEVYAMSCYDQYKPVEMEVYKSNVTTLDAGDLGKAGSISSRTWKVPANAAVGSTYVVMVEVGDQASISNYRLPASTKFDYAAAAVKKTIIIRKPTPTPNR